MKPEISIIVPVYKTEKFLKTCIESIIGQTFGNWELILVDDCSPDGSWKILAEYEKRESRIRVVTHSVNRGVSQARFTGLESGRGRYVVFVDSDDRIPCGALRALYDRIEEDRSDMVIGSTVKVIDRYGIFRTKAGNAMTPKNRTESITAPELFDKYFINYFGVNIFSTCMWGKIYRRETIDKAPLRPVPFSWGEDLVFNMTLHPYLTRIGFITDTVYYYRFGGGTSTSTPYLLDVSKKLYLLKEEYIAKYAYDKATPTIKIELVNCFYAHFRNLVMLDKLSYDALEKLIAEELRDDFYKKDLRVDIWRSDRAEALDSGDVAGMVDLIRKDVRRTGARHMLIKGISKIFMSS